MSTLSLSLPDSLRRGVEAACQQEGITVNHFISLAIAEKLSALLTEDYLQKRAKNGSRESYEAALAKVPDVEPEEKDDKVLPTGTISN